MKKIRKKLISPAVAELWLSLFNANGPAFPNGGEMRKTTAGFIQLMAKEERKFRVIYDKFQRKYAAFTAKKKKAMALRINSDQTVERSVLFSDLIFNWVSDMADFCERGVYKMRKEVGKKPSVLKINL